MLVESNDVTTWLPTDTVPWCRPLHPCNCSWRRQNSIRSQTVLLFVRPGVLSRVLDSGAGVVSTRGRAPKGAKTEVACAGENGWNSAVLGENSPSNWWLHLTIYRYSDGKWMLPNTLAFILTINLIVVPTFVLLCIAWFSKSQSNTQMFLLRVGIGAYKSYGARPWDVCSSNSLLESCIRFMCVIAIFDKEH